VPLFRCLKHPLAAAWDHPNCLPGRRALDLGETGLRGPRPCTGSPVCAGRWTMTPSRPTAVPCRRLRRALRVLRSLVRWISLRPKQSRVNRAADASPPSRQQRSGPRWAGEEARRCYGGLAGCARASAVMPIPARGVLPGRWTRCWRESSCSAAGPAWSWRRPSTRALHLGLLEAGCNQSTSSLLGCLGETVWPPIRPGPLAVAPDAHHGRSPAPDERLAPARTISSPPSALQRRSWCCRPCGATTPPRCPSRWLTRRDMFLSGGAAPPMPGR